MRHFLFGFQDSKPLMLSNVRTVKMNDDVLAVVVSPDAKYIAVALLDCTVKVQLISLNFPSFSFTASSVSGFAGLLCCSFLNHNLTCHFISNSSYWE